MTSQDFYLYGLKSVMECISRAVLLSQPADIHDFLSQYFSGLIDYRDSQLETDPKKVSYNYQEQWEIQFQKRRKTSTTSTERNAESQRLPTLDGEEQASSDLVFSGGHNLGSQIETEKPEKKNEPVRPTGVGRRGQKTTPSATPVFRKSINPVPPPRKANKNTSVVSSVKTAAEKQGTGATERPKTDEFKRTMPLTSKKLSKSVTVPSKTRDRTKDTVSTTAGSKSRAVSLPSKYPDGTTDGIKTVKTLRDATAVLKRATEKPQHILPSIKTEVSTPADGLGSISSQPSKPLEGTTDNAKRPLHKIQPVLPPIQKKAAVNQPTKLSQTAQPTGSMKCVLPPISQKQSRGGQLTVVKGKDLTVKPKTDSKINMRVVQGKTKTSAPKQETADGPKKAAPVTFSSRHTGPLIQTQKLENMKSNLKVSPIKHRHVLPPIQQKTADNQPSKLSQTNQPTGSMKCVLPPISQKQTRGGQLTAVKGMNLTFQPETDSKINKEVVQVEPKTYAPIPETTNGPEKPAPVTSSSRHTQPSIQRQKLEKMKGKLKVLPDKPKAPKVPWEDIRVPAVKERKISGTTAAGSNNCSCPCAPIHVIRYKRLRIIATEPDQ